MCYGFVPVENPTSFVLKSPQKILHKIRPKKVERKFQVKQVKNGVRILDFVFRIVTS